MSTVTEDSISMPALSRGTNGGVKSNSNSSSGEEVRTLFVSGLPMDVRLRELYLLFRSCEGYEGSFLKLISSKPGKIPQPIAFVSFATRKQAEKVLEELQGIRFDPASAQTLRLEFARTNSRVSPKQQPYLSHSSSPPLPSIRNGQYLYYVVSKGGSQYVGGNSLAVSPGGQNLMTLADCWASMRVNNMVSPVSYNGVSPPPSPDSSTAHLSVLSILSDSESSTYPTPASTPDKVEEPTSKLTSTLVVGNLDRRVKEDDINSVFNSCSGFVKVSMCTEDTRSPEAIVEFKDHECAKMALERFQGCRFDWSTGEGIHIEYDGRNPPSIMEFSQSPPMDTSVSPAVSYSPVYNAFPYQTNLQQPMVHMIPKDVNDTLNCSPVLSPANSMEHYANASPFMYSGPVFMH